MLMVNPAAPMVRARKLAEGGSVMLMVAIVAVVASAVRQHVADPALDAIALEYSSLQGANHVLINSVLALPSIYLILALWQLRTAVEECFFTRAAGSALRRAGYWALWALFAKMLLAPTLYGMFSSGSFGVVVTYETFDVGMVGFSALLMLAGHVLETATTREFVEL
jgi:hypothetical protein